VQRTTEAIGMRVTLSSAFLNTGAPPAVLRHLLGLMKGMKNGPLAPAAAGSCCVRLTCWLPSRVAWKPGRDLNERERPMSSSDESGSRVVTLGVILLLLLLIGGNVFLFRQRQAAIERELVAAEHQRLLAEDADRRVTEALRLAAAKQAEQKQEPTT
jgi:hypothetical protein